MIIKLEYEDIGLVGIKTNYNNKVKNHYIRFIVDEYCVEKAIKEAENNKWVVALDYEGDFQYLFNLEEVPKIPVIITKEFTEINELSIATILYLNSSSPVFNTIVSSTFIFAILAIF